MQRTNKYLLWLLAPLLLAACERDFNIEVDMGPPRLIVEAYVNNLLPLYNYVVLSRSQDYYSADLDNVPVSGATVTITEGTVQADRSIRWDTANRAVMQELALPRFDLSLLPGVYLDRRLANTPNRALIGKPGKSYLLEIEESGKKYSAITTIPQPVPIDSLTNGNVFLEYDDDGVGMYKSRITVHFQDPDTIGNAQLYFWRHQDNRAYFGWGGMHTNRFTPNTDEKVNGEYLHITHSNGFALTDTVVYYLASVERKVYNFWDSYNKARDNGGPFSTPVNLLSTIQGPDVIGSFSGFGMSTKTHVVQ
ncbi:MAG: DUF4249 domain-containing protein [Candidatus Pseudobacter hemicellulosilyticus]|uniref:DUF4249 domain-containing protein n=1 Tax=Candidatus Pseudobacter hemicellulosilyticus TaxID=3121375 RepID=A0AAJ5WPD8_9BACT|nr:MAG: DUF4249 domain-containing protein [Pseudobacter sp.]